MSGAGDANSILKGGGTDLTRSTGQVKNGDIAAAKRRSLQLNAETRAARRRAEAEKLAAIKQRVEDVLASNPKLAALKSQIRLEMTPDGLRIQIVDEQSRAMFDSGSAVVKPYMRELLREIGSVLAEVPNRLTLEGHTDAEAFGNGERGYSNWELSSDRANASRRELGAGGLPPDHVLRVQGLASSVLLEPKAPTGAANRRISIIVMNRDAEDRLLQPAPQADPEPKAGADPDAVPEPEHAASPVKITLGLGRPSVVPPIARPLAPIAPIAPVAPIVARDTPPALPPRERG